MFKRVIMFSFIIISLIVIIIAIIKNPKEIKITVIEESYSDIKTNDKKFNLGINIIINQKYSYITNLEYINNAYIGNDNDLLKVNINEINYNFDTKIRNEKYFHYTFNLSIETEFPIEIDQAELRVTYLNDNEISIVIGAISLYRVNDNDYKELSITNLKGIINTINNKKTLVGILIEIENNSNSVIEINNINLLNLNTYVTGLYEVDDIIISYTDDISKIIQNSYSITDIEIIPKVILSKTKRFIITLGYNNHYQIPKLAFNFDYSFKGLNRIYHFSEFTFFNNHMRYIPINELKFYVYYND